MIKKEYSRPELTFTVLCLRDVICSSVEELSSQINQGGFSSLPDDDIDDDIID